MFPSSCGQKRRTCEMRLSFWIRPSTRLLAITNLRLLRRWKPLSLNIKCTDTTRLLPTWIRS